MCGCVPTVRTTVPKGEENIAMPINSILYQALDYVITVIVKTVAVFLNTQACCQITEAEIQNSGEYEYAGHTPRYPSHPHL